MTSHSTHTRRQREKHRRTQIEREREKQTHMTSVCSVRAITARLSDEQSLGVTRISGLNDVTHDSAAAAEASYWLIESDHDAVQ